jgi:hypothetical protein
VITDQLVDALSPFADLILPGFYLAFLGGTLLILVLKHRAYARRLWLTGFLSSLLVVTLLGAPILPVVDMHKFPDPSPEERTYHELRVVDADGEEVRYDARAVPPMQGTRTSRLGRWMVEDYSDEKRLEIAGFLIREAEEYRASLLAGGRAPIERLQPPRYVDEERWTAAEVRDLSRFESIRVYRHTIVYDEDSTGIESRETELRLEVTPGDDTIEE